ncbi:MAG: hypothetical protein ACYCZ6_09780 [Polaromonas sp.]
MMINKLAMGSLAFSVADAALAGVTLGTSLGRPLGAVLGLPLGFDLPIAGWGLLAVAAVSLVIGIGIVRRKQDR